MLLVPGDPNSSLRPDIIIQVDSGLFPLPIRTLFNLNPKPYQTFLTLKHQSPNLVNPTRTFLTLNPKQPGPSQPNPDPLDPKP